MAALFLSFLSLWFSTMYIEKSCGCFCFIFWRPMQGMIKFVNKKKERENLAEHTQYYWL